MGEARTVGSLLRPGEADGSQAALETDGPQPVTGVVPPSASRSKLRRTLVVSDVLTACAAWSLAPFVPWAPMIGVPGGWWAAVPPLTGITVLLLWVAGLHRGRVCSVRTTEVLRIGYVCCAMAAASQAAPDAWVASTVSATMVVGATVVFLALVASRSIYRNWLLAKRATGHLLRTVAIIGADEEAGRLGVHLDEHPEVGYDVVGYFRSSVGHAAHLARPMLGQALDAPVVLGELGINGAIVVPGALLPSERQEVLAGLAAAKVHVHLATGLQGIDSRRLRSLPMGHEPLLYLEPPGRNAPWYPYLKRMIDIVGASVALLLTAPLYLLAAIAIKVTDGGPVLFRQVRAGMGNRTFELFKLRSMTVDAEAQLADLMAHNQRDGGPLFKLDHDPRVTKVGAILRATSFDEIPQLLNVLRGEMSLVGPRPALPDEVAVFDEELLVRQQVRPGVTGLWQVEARDNPSFSAYRYLDVFYVDNQSLALDLTILIGTVRAVARSCLRALRVGQPSLSAPSVMVVPEPADA